jgi:hypothetical protein
MICRSTRSWPHKQVDRKIPDRYRITTILADSKTKLSGFTKPKNEWNVLLCDNHIRKFEGLGAVR